MGIAQFLASFRRKPKTDAKQQKTPGTPTQRQTHHPHNNPPFITPPAPVASVRSRRTQVAPAEYTPDIDRNAEGAQQTRYPDPWLQRAQDQRRTDTPPANLDAQGDLGLQGNARFNNDELFLPPSRAADPAAVAKDSENRRLSLTCRPHGAPGERIRYLRSEISVRDASTAELPEEDLGAHRFPEVEDEEERHFWIEHGPDIPVPGPSPLPIPPQQSKAPSTHPSPSRIPSQTSSITLCGTLSPTTNTYKIPPSPFHTTCTFLRPLGQGGFGKIELHRHNPTSTLLVLKRARLSNEYIRGLPAEIHILKTVIANRHPHLPTLFHTNTSLAEIHIWQNYADGGDLAQLSAFFTARRRRIPEAFIWHCLTHLSSALAYLHTGLLILPSSPSPSSSSSSSFDPSSPPPTNWEPVLHRDIKPENIFLTLLPTETHIYPSLILGDFGLATTKPQTSTLCGSPCWQPPEVPVQTPASDVWAVGAVIHSLAVGGPPMLPPPEDYPYDTMYWECEPGARRVWDVEREAGYSAYLREALGEEWLAWEAERRPVGLKGCLRASGGRTCFLADERMVVEGLGSWWGWVRRQAGRGAGVEEVRGEGARGFEE